MSQHQSEKVNYQINLSFQEITLPPFEDILIVGSQSKQGRMGLSKTFDYLVPMSFEMIEVDEDDVSVIFVSTKILKKVPKDKVMAILQEKVFPFVSKDELLKVTFKVTVNYEAIEITK
jgi:hypothetical protein